MREEENGADALIRAIHEAGVKVCFANPGTTEMCLVSALDKVPGIKCVLGLHETICTGACDGYARLSRSPAMALLHLGPGLCNGLANLHNSRRAKSPALVVIGDMASWHKGADPLLNMDIESLASSVSSSVVTVKDPVEDVQAVLTSMGSELLLNSRIGVVIVPHDLGWEKCSCRMDVIPTPAAAVPRLPAPDTLQQFVQACAADLRSCQAGEAALYLGGEALLAKDGALQSAGRIAAACGATLLCENAFAIADRGAGLPHLQRVPYFPQEAAAVFRRFKVLVLLGATRPVANFGYRDGPSQLITQPDEHVWEFDARGGQLLACLKQLEAAICPPISHAALPLPIPVCKRPPLPSGRLNQRALCQAVAALQPPDAIVVDESLTSGTEYWELSKDCPPFSHLTLTGGAIGSGPPLAIGAAVACPQRKVVNIQADGSALYAPQAFWTQAREKLDIVTIICANRAYAILQVESARQRLPPPGPATRSLTQLTSPTIDWVALAQAMGITAATRATSAEELVDQLSTALSQQGPALIEAVLS